MLWRSNLTAHEIEDTPDDGSTVVGLSRRDQFAVALGFPVLGGLGGWLVRLLAGWIGDLDWVPLPGRFRFVVELATAEPYATVGSIVLGAVAGGVVAMFAIGEDLRVTIDDDTLHLRLGDDADHIDRAAISAVFRDGPDLVVLGTEGQELARWPCDHGKKLADAFLGHGFPWEESDPYADAYRRWVPDLPGLPEGADALLRARAQALEEDDADDARQLRAELAELGVVVRDDEAKQFWRLQAR